MKRLLVLLTLLGTLVLLVQCKHDPFPPVAPSETSNTPVNDPDEPCDPDVVYFERDVMPILTSNCNMSGCHGNGSAEDGVDLTTYQKVKKTGKVKPKDAKESELYEVLKEKPEDRMPKGMPPLPEEKIAIIRKWIEQGAENLTCTENTSSCNTDNISFKNNVVPILNTYCTGCHTGTASGGVDLSIYDGVKSVAKNGKLYGAISHTSSYPMPKGGQKLDQCKIDQIKSWIDAGAQNN